MKNCCKLYEDTESNFLKDKYQFCPICGKKFEENSSLPEKLPLISTDPFIDNICKRINQIINYLIKRGL